ncbi:undecaprenyl-diphosphate phosphatase [Jongsikchunia kroppenstedtii]|uniref:undecaprenyl-diphosphate phosphatase n=1 Tax=Jongsikchunia kroppenstedtii TaxID=1121721 RepID=UPI00035E3B22|nr:undecaprenyl-diphosphate phosphatase [Jongsikchunia kroppenstedtii]
MSTLTYAQSVVLGALQGVTELFPISSLGHSVLVPAWIGGAWQQLVTEGDSKNGTPFLAFIVALHVATAFALLWFYWRDWVDVIGAFLTTLRTRRIETSSQKLAWMIIVATIPVGIVGLVLDKPLRELFAKPLAAAIFLTINGLVLATVEMLRRRSAALVEARPSWDDPHHDREITALSFPEAGGIGSLQILALFAGISRSGVTIVGGLLRGLNHEDAAKFAFMLATPVILAAGVLKIPELAGPQGDGIHGQIIVGAVVAFVAAFVSVKFLTKFFTTRTLTPFAIYCLVAGIASVIRFAV